jgi:hypothetical protein
MWRSSPDHLKGGRTFVYGAGIGQVSRLLARIRVGHWLAVCRRFAKALFLGQGADTDREGDQPEPRSETPDLPRDDSGEVDWARVEPFDSGFFRLEHNDYVPTLLHFPPAEDEESPYRTTWDPS